MKIIYLDTIDSTNTYAKNMLSENKIRKDCCIAAHEQTAGKGMKNNKWFSEPFKNLTFSLICFTDFLPLTKQFRFNQMVALSVFQFVKTNCKEHEVNIKWPNDIYVGNEKIAGILIETSVMGSKMKYAIIGIGINVNQTEFPAKLPNPTSLSLINSKEYDLAGLLKQFTEIFEHNLQLAKELKFEGFNKEYLKHLYRKDIPAFFYYKKKKINGTIVGVNPNGLLQIETPDNILLECNNKDLEYEL